MPLTDIQIRQAKPGEKPRKLSDERGLFIEIRPTGAKLWRYRYKIEGKENVFALGEYPEMGLADARAERDKARALVKQGRHPSHVRRTARAKQMLESQSSFKAVTLEWIDSKTGITDGYRSQLTRAFTKNLFPYVGRMPVRDVTAAHLLECLRRMEARGATYYAISLCNWLSQMFRYAVRTLRADTWRAWPRPNQHPASKPTCRSRKPPSLTRHATTACVARPRRSVMRDLMAELKELRLHGMATAWAELLHRVSRTQPRPSGCSNTCWNKSTQIAPCAR